MRDAVHVVLARARRSPRRASGARKCGSITIAIAYIALARPGPRIATTATASSRLGSASITSISRMIDDLDERRGRSRRRRPSSDAERQRQRRPRPGRSAATAACRGSAATGCRGRPGRCRAGSVRCRPACHDGGVSVDVAELLVRRMRRDRRRRTARSEHQQRRRAPRPIDRAAVLRGSRARTRAAAGDGGAASAAAIARRLRRRRRSAHGGCAD